MFLLLLILMLLKVFFFFSVFLSFRRIIMSNFITYASPPSLSITIPYMLLVCVYSKFDNFFLKKSSFFRSNRKLNCLLSRIQKLPKVLYDEAFQVTKILSIGLFGTLHHSSAAALSLISILFHCPPLEST